MVHPGYPNGAATGLFVKNYRGKDAYQEVWKFDSGAWTSRFSLNCPYSLAACFKSSAIRASRELRRRAEGTHQPRP